MTHALCNCSRLHLLLPCVLQALFVVAECPKCSSELKFDLFKFLVRMKLKQWTWRSARYFFLSHLILCLFITLDMPSCVTNSMS